MTDLPPPLPPLAAVPDGYVAYGAAPSAGRQPSAGSVFGQLVWRIIVLSTVGGAAIGVGFMVVGAFVSGDSELATYGFAAAMVGAIFGLVLGVPAGLVLGGIGCAMLVPYRGKSFTHWWARISAVVAVGIFYAWLWSNLNTAELAPLLGLTVPGVLGAFFGSWFLVRWYTKRMAD